MKKNYDSLSPLQKFNLLAVAICECDTETMDFIEKDLGLDKVPYPYENMD